MKGQGISTSQVNEKLQILHNIVDRVPFINFMGIKFENSISHSSASLSVLIESEAKLQESPLTSSGNGIAWFVIGLDGGARLTPVYPFC